MGFCGTVLWPCRPDPGNGHNHPHMVDPADAARDWVHVQDAADQTGLALVSPALSTTGLDDDGVSPWMDQFLGNCTSVVSAKGRLNSKINAVGHFPGFA